MNRLLHVDTKTMTISERNKAMQQSRFWFPLNWRVGKVRDAIKLFWAQKHLCAEGSQTNPRQTG